MPSIILNNSLKTGISIPKPISTSAVVSSNINTTTVLTPQNLPASGIITRAKSEKVKEEIIPEAVRSVL